MDKETLQQYWDFKPVANIEWEGKTLSFLVSSNNAYWRADSFHGKEPDTLEWIAGFEVDDVFLDVGANVGLYTIAAAAIGSQVFAFEPESLNFALLNRNIFENDLGSRVKAFCAALSDKQEFGNLFLSNFEEGGSCHSFGEEVDFHLKPRPSKFPQGCFSFKLDDLVQKGAIPVPNHIKIDVDGIEHKVLAGAADTLNKSAVKSVLVELNTHLEQHRDLINEMIGLGFSLTPGQVEAAIRKEGPFEGIGNHIFRR